MESQDLKRWEFHRELISMAASCVGLKPNTAKKKAAAIFNKYSPIISSSESMEAYYKNQWNETYNKYEEEDRCSEKFAITMADILINLDNYSLWDMNEEQIYVWGLTTECLN